MQNLLSSEKRTLDHWATVQFFFSLAQVRCFWQCFCFRRGLVALFLKMSERGDSWCTDSSFSSLLVERLIGFAWQYSQACGHPYCLCSFYYPISSFQSTLHLICFDTALLEQEIPTHLYCMDGHLLKLKCEYANILRYWFLTFISCKRLIIKLKQTKHLKCFTLHVMNLKYMTVSLFEISCKKKKNFHHIQIFWDVPVYYTLL